MRKSVQRATAFHEAGHVVAAWRHHLKLKGATIVASADASGQAESVSPLRGVDVEIDGSTRARMRAETQILILLAGPAAQRQHAPRSWRHHHGRSDYDLACDLSLRLNGSGEAASAYLKWLEIVARQMIAGSWPYVERVAEALLKRGTLSSPDLVLAMMPKRGPVAVDFVDENGTRRREVIDLVPGT